MFRINKFRESIFLKIILVFGLAAIGNAAVLRVFQHDLLFNDVSRQHRSVFLVETSELLASHFHYPPTQQELLDASKRLHLAIRAEGDKAQPSGDFEMTASGFPALKSVPSFVTVNQKMEMRYSKDGARAGRYGDFLAVDIKVAPAENKSVQVHYLIFLESENAIDAHPELLLVLLASLLAILTLCFFAVRRILAPLKEIERGVADVALGKLDTTVAIRSRDELGRLAKQFNAMIERVRNMISAKEQLLLDVSHEFRSPLTRIRVALEIPGEPARLAIVRAIKDLETMLAELLESARLGDVQGRLKLEEIDLAETLHDLAEMYEDQKPGIKLELADTAHSCFADPARLQIALRNLVENAFKYSSHQALPVELSLKRVNKSTVRITVCDHGMGMAADELEFIFEPFYRVDRSRVKATGGYGLGLALSKKIISAHLGSIHVESTPGKGSCFIIDLPCEGSPA